MRRILYLILLLYVALLPFERLLRFVSDSGEDSILKPYRVVGMVFCAVCVAWLASGSSRPKFDVGDKTFLLIFGWGVLMAFFWNVVEGNNLTYTAQGLPLILFGLSTYIAIKAVNLTSREIQGLFVMLSGALLVAVALSQVLVGELTGRMKGLYKNPNQLGLTAALCFIFLFQQFAFLPRPRLASQVVRALLAASMAALIALSGSRGATSAALFGTMVLLVTMVRRRILLAGAARLAAFAALLGLLALASLDRFEAAWEQTDSQSRFEQDVAREGAEERWELWVSGVNVGLDHYGLGVGSMQYLTYHLDSVKHLRGQISSTDRALGTHSDYVDLFASYGILGLIAFLRYAWLRWRSVWSVITDSKTTAETTTILPLALGLLAATLTIMVSQNSFTGGEYFLTMALVDAIARLAARNRSPETVEYRATAPAGALRPNHRTLAPRAHQAR